MLNPPPTQPTPIPPSGATRPDVGGRRRSSAPPLSPPTGSRIPPISAELPVVATGPDGEVTAQPWEAPPLPPTRPVNRLSGEVPAVGDRLDGLVRRATPPGGEPQVTTRADYGLSDLEPFAPDAAPPRRSRGGGPGPGSGPGGGGPVASPGTLPRRPFGDEGFGPDGYDDGYDERDDDFDGSERSGCGRLAVPMVVAAVVLCLLLVAAAVWARRQIDPGGPEGKAVTVKVVSGQSTSDIGHALQKSHVITNSGVWTWYVRLRGGGDVQAGSYEMHENMSMGDALDALTTGPLPPDARKVTIAEGLDLKQMTSRLTSGDHAVKGFTAKGMQAAFVDPSVRSKYLPSTQANIEGTLFPETYNLAEDATEKDLVAKMVDQFDAVADELQLNAGAERLGYKPYEVLIVASLIEEEAKVDEERPKVARVIYNRLEQGIPLGIDATSCYEKSTSPCRLSTADLNSTSPYNTRHKKGLPPTPISAPGRASLEAALNPAQGNWIYYVLADAQGHHVFTADVNEFNQAKQACKDAGLGCG
jgi:UPF0755 protein